MTSHQTILTRNQNTEHPESRSPRNFPRLTVLLTAFLLFVLPPLHASEPSMPIDPELMPVMEKLLSLGLEANEVKSLFTHPKLSFNPATPSLFFLVQESRLDYDQFSSPESLAKARAYMKTYATPLARAEKKYGVPRTVICAILLVETRLGTFVGRHSAAASLASIAALDSPEVQHLVWERVRDKTPHDRKSFEERAKNRAAWALKELPPLMHYARAKGINAAEIPGSYAGAVGLCQFMPSNIQQHAADGDKDGKIRLSTHEDAIFSAARYLKNNGWKQGMTLGQQEKIILTYNKSRPYAQAVLRVAGELRKKTPLGSREKKS